MKVSHYAKAVVAAIMAGAGSLGTAMQDGVVTQGEGVTAVLLTLGALGVVWKVPNRQEPKDQA
ncbi:hypothetical protein STRCI_001250 [Streptomyces cinnabarinus]|uniref:Holin n=1 Tax=Streptomyces cinnabarinus TaxID=67287 RepID=A0ABY7KB46_9ACTN|nr:hypothetical protein [Streptomyces cinnabarinus]WAZ20151.1 hypothetical protein STRCI_001250 [Streptomyces cinnabarinus]